MKKSFLIICLMLGMSPAFAQNKAVNKANQLLEDKKLVEAKEQIDLAVAHEKTIDKPKTWYTKGLIYSAIARSEDPAVKNAVQNPLEEAVAAFDKAKELEGGKETATYYFLSDQSINSMFADFVNKGAQAHDAQKFEEALPLFEKAIKVKPADTIAYLYAGIAAKELGNEEKSSNYFYQLIDAGSKNRGVYGELLNYEYKEKKDYDKALEVVNRAMETFPNDPEFLMSKVHVLLKQEKAAEAKELLTQATAADPNNPELFFNIGALNDELGEEAAAIDAYKKALAIDPDHKKSAYNLALIQFYNAEDLIKEANSLGLGKENEKKMASLKQKAGELFKVAVPYVENALRLHPDNRDVMGITLVTYYRAGMKEKADALQAKLDALEK